MEFLDFANNSGDALALLWDGKPGSEASVLMLALNFGLVANCY
jgi:hypothetical protein